MVVGAAGGELAAEAGEVRVALAVEGVKQIVITTEDPSRSFKLLYPDEMPLRDKVKTEIRRVPSIDEFPKDNVWVQKERAWRESTGQL